MKTKKIVLVILIGIMTAVVLTGCGQKESEAEPNISSGNDSSVSIFRGVIEEIEGTTATIKVNDDQQHILSSGDKVNVNLSIVSQEFLKGDEIVVYYAGSVMESYPLQVDTVDIKLASEFDNMLTEEENLGTPTAKIVINIEGVVTEINGDRITLDNGKIVIINEATQFETQNVGEIVKIDDNILVGNFIQGFTQDDENSAVVTALVINTNALRN